MKYQPTMFSLALGLAILKLKCQKNISKLVIMSYTKMELVSNFLYNRAHLINGAN